MNATARRQKNNSFLKKDQVVGVRSRSNQEQAHIYYRPISSSLIKRKVLGAPCILNFEESKLGNKERSHAIVAELYLLKFLEEQYMAASLRIENEENSASLL